MKCHLICADVLDGLAQLADESVQCVVTSPPYWGLRDYGVPGQIGLESTPEEYVSKMVAVFREVRRVLRKDGTLWLNIGDSYNAYNGGAGPSSQLSLGAQTTERPKLPSGYGLRCRRLKPKDLVGIPWMLAFALRADGWYLRSDIIWAKPNPMPESVTDRPTKAHEYLFLLAKGQWKSRVVKFSDLSGKTVHFGKDLRANAADSGPGRFCVRLATAIFDRAQREQGFSLPPFYAQEWQQRADCGDGNLVGGLPPKHVPTAWAARFLNGDATAEQFLHQVNRLPFTLSYRDDLLVGGAASELLNAPRVDSDGKGTVTIHDAGEVCEIDFVHAQLNIKSPRHCSYYYDAQAIKEDSVTSDPRVPYTSEGAKKLDGRPSEQWRSGKVRTKKPDGWATHKGGHGSFHRDGREKGETVEVDAFEKRNKRSVWTIPTEPFPEAHFATFPTALVEPCILAGSKVGDAILDPFAGSGTVGVVALGHQRDFVGIELNPEYVKMARKRLESVAPMFTDLTSG